MATIIPPPIVDRGLQQALMGFAQPLAQGLAIGGQRRLTQQDIQALQQWQQRQNIYNTMYGARGLEAPQAQFPQMRSQMGQQLAMTGMMGNIFQEPMLPTQQIAEKKLNQINLLQAKVNAGIATPNEKAMLEKMLAGQPMVQIGLGQPASPSERKEIAETRASIDALDNLKNLFDSAQTKTGPITGRVSPLAGLMGMTTDEQEAFMAATFAFKNAIIKEITGSQLSEHEANRIMKQVPDITDPPARWKAKWEQSRKNLEMLQKRRMQILQQSGIRVPIGEQAITIEKPLISNNQIAYQEGQTAVNPKTGKRIIFRNGKWQPVK